MLIPTTVLTTGGTTVADPVQQVFGTPDTAFEFDSASLSGLTAIGTTPDVEAANTLIPSHYYVERRTNSGGIMGRYLAPPSPPWTAIVKLTSNNVFTDFNKSLMFIAADSTGVPGTLDLFSHVNVSGSRIFSIDRWTNPTTFSSGVTTGVIHSEPPLWMAIKATSATDYDYLASMSGHVWYPILRTRNPSLTIAWLGIGVTCENASNESAAAFDYLRIWNSAKTFYGAV